MIILINNWRQKVKRLLLVLVLLLLIAVTLPVFAGKLYQQVPVNGPWFDEEQPSGNPMRVERKGDDTRFAQVMDQFVIKLQDFYYEDRN